MRSDTGRDSQYVVGGSSSPNRFTAATFSIPDMTQLYFSVLGRKWRLLHAQARNRTRNDQLLNFRGSLEDGVNTGTEAQNPRKYSISHATV